MKQYVIIKQENRFGNEYCWSSYDYNWYFKLFGPSQHCISYSEKSAKECKESLVAQKRELPKYEIIEIVEV